MLRSLVFVFVAFVLTGCVFSSPPSLDVDQPTARPLHLKKTHQIDNPIRVGAQIHIKDPAFLGDVQALVGQEYVSALGQKCYRIKVLDSDVASDRVVLCKSLTGHWIVAPPVWAKPVKRN